LLPGDEALRYLGSADTGVFSITLEGAVSGIFDEPRRISVSPNKEYLVLFDPRGEGTTVLYSGGSGQLLDLSTDEVECVLWAPQSDAFYLISSHELYRYDLALAEMAPVADGLADSSFPACGIRHVGNGQIRLPNNSLKPTRLAGGRQGCPACQVGPE
jgi:hypothetical protein